MREDAAVTGVEADNRSKLAGGFGRQAGIRATPYDLRWHSKKQKGSHRCEPFEFMVTGGIEPPTY